MGMSAKLLWLSQRMSDMAVIAIGIASVTFASSCEDADVARYM